MPPPLKILHIVAGAPHGGAETFCLDAIKALHGRGIAQEVVCRPHPALLAALEEAGIGYHCLSFGRLRARRERRQIARIAAEYNPALVHCWMSRAASRVPPGCAAPVLGWFGGYYDLKYYRRCDFYMGVTADIVRHIVRKAARPQRSFLVHTFGTLERAAPLSLAGFGIPEGAKTVLLLSRMHWKKGVDTLLRAAALLKDPDAYFLLAGDGPELGKYKRLAQKLGVEERVRFLGWRNDRAALLEVADVCVLPSRYEPFGTVIAEAWHAGVPLVAAKAAGARQYVTDGVDGLLCEIGDAAMLAAKIKTALEDEALRRRLVAGGREKYDALFNKNAVIDSLLEAYALMVRAGKFSAAYMDAGLAALPPGLEKPLQEMGGGLPAHKVAAAYALAHGDGSLALDAARIEAEGLRRLFRKGLFRASVEILSEAEIDILLLWQRRMRARD